MKANFPGRCEKCGGFFGAGEEITWAAATETRPPYLAHDECPEHPTRKVCRDCQEPLPLSQGRCDGCYEQWATRILDLHDAELEKHVEKQRRV